MMRVRHDYVFSLFISLLVISRIAFDGFYKISLGPFELTYIIGVVLVILGIFFLFTRINQGLTIFLIFNYLLLSAWCSFERWGNAGFEEVFRSFGIVSLFLIVRSLKSPFSRAMVVDGLCVSGFLSGILSIFQFVTQQGLLVEGIIRCPGFFAHPNSAALFYGSVIVVQASRKRTHSIRLNLLLFFVLSAALIFTASLSGIFVTILGITWQAILKKRISRYVLMAPFASVGLFFVFTKLAPQISIRLNNFFNPNRFQSQTESNSFEWRLARWMDLLNYWRETPVFGQGYGASTNGGMLSGYLPHSEYIRALVELGLVGLVLMLVVLVFSMFYFYRLVNTSNSELWAVCTSSILIMSVISAFTENTFVYTTHGYVIAIMAGVAMAFEDSRKST